MYPYLASNIDYLFEKNKTNPNKLSKEIEVGQATLFRIQSRITGQPKRDVLNKIANWAGVTVEQLTDVDLSQNEVFGNVRPTGKALREIPLLDYVQAGLFHDVGYDGVNPLGVSWTTYNSPRPECVFSLEVEGDSMSPEFKPGDEIVVDGSLEAKPGALVIAQEVQHGQARTTFKKYRVIGINEFGVDVIELVPLNPDYPTFNSNQIEISIIGVVVEHNRKFKY